MAVRPVDGFFAKGYLQASNSNCLSTYRTTEEVVTSLVSVSTKNAYHSMAQKQQIGFAL